MTAKWDIEGGAECYDKCSHIEKQKPHGIYMSKDMWDVVCAMLLKFPYREWQMLFTGTITPAGVECTGYIIPKQETSSAYVSHKDDISAELIKEKGIVCGIHSHVNMDVSPSHTDINDSVMSLIDYHMIVNNRHEINGMRKAKLPCGGLSVAKCEVFTRGGVDLATLPIVGLENITEKKYEYTGMNTRLFENDVYVPSKVGKSVSTPAYSTLYYRDYSVEEELRMSHYLMQEAV